MSDQSATILRWEDPPPSTKGNGRPGSSKWAPVFKMLANRPGEWAVIAEGLKKAGNHFTRQSSTSYVALVRAGVDPDAYEVQSRMQPDGTYTVYARFVGLPLA